MAKSLRESATALHQALMDDAQACLAAGLSPHEWQKRVHLLLAYSLPPEHVEHRQDKRGHWLHIIRTKGSKNGR